MSDELTTHIETVLTADVDIYRVGAAIVMGKPTAEVTASERFIFKVVFHRVYRLKALDLLVSNHEYIEDVVAQLKQRGLFTEIDAAVCQVQRDREAV